MNDNFLQTKHLDLGGDSNTPGDHVPQLITLEGLRPGMAYPLVKDRTEIGRLATNDVVLASEPVSKRHAALNREHDLFFVEDLGSTNGVFVNDTRLGMDSRRRLYHGDNIRISDHLFLFRQESNFVAPDGSCAIELDQEKIDAEVREFLAGWQDAQSGGSIKSH